MRPSEKEVRDRLVELWIEKAAQDLRAAEALIQNEPPVLYAACFHCQQACEKYIKAFLTKWQIEFPKTHDIRQLLELVAKVSAKLAEELAGAAVLTPYGVETRYPGDLPELSRDEGVEALRLARLSARAVSRRLAEQQTGD